AADQLRADVARRRALSQRRAHPVTNLNGGLRILHTDAVLLQALQELLVSGGARVGGTRRDQRSQAQRARGNRRAGDGLGESRSEHFGGLPSWVGLAGEPRIRPTPTRILKRS